MFSIAMTDMEHLVLKRSPILRDVSKDTSNLIEQAQQSQYERNSYSTSGVSNISSLARHECLYLVYRFNEISEKL